MSKGIFEPIRDTERARTLGKMGGVKSGKVRRDKRDLRKVLAELLSLPAEDGSGSNVEAVALSMLQKAIGGDCRAAEFLRDTVSGKPTVRQEIEAKSGCRLVLLGDDPDAGKPEAGAD